MAQTLVPTAATGRAGKILQGDGRVTAFKHFIMDFDTSNYVVGGEDIDLIWEHFKEVLQIDVSQWDTNTAADRRDFGIDYTAKTLLVYDAFNTEETASNQTVIKVGLLAYGVI